MDSEYTHQSVASIHSGDWGELWRGNTDLPPSPRDGFQFEMDGICAVDLSVQAIDLRKLQL